MKKGLYLILGRKLIFSIVLSVFSFVILSISFSTVKTVSVNAVISDAPLIIIDAGHGGEDGGTQSADGVLEKHINLAISEKLETTLKKYGFRTLMVRNEDALIYDNDCTTMRSKKSSDIHKRLEFMKNHPDCIFVSIHQNYFKDSKYSGAQVFYRPQDENSRILADSIQKSIVNFIQKENTRQIKSCTSDVYLIYNAVSTAVMVECGFLSNKEEALKLNNSTYQSKVADAIAHGIINYLQYGK